MACRNEELRNLHSLTRCTPHGVMAEDNQAQIEDRAGSHPAYRDSHSASAVRVEARLGPIASVIYFNRRIG
jgi:hypothetical protein